MQMARREPAVLITQGSHVCTESRKASAKQCSRAAAASSQVLLQCSDMHKPARCSRPPFPFVVRPLSSPFLILINQQSFGARYSHPKWAKQACFALLRHSLGSAADATAIPTYLGTLHGKSRTVHIQRALVNSLLSFGTSTSASSSHCAWEADDSKQATQTHRGAD